MTATSKWSKVKYQLLATIAGNIVVLAQGTANGWLSPAYPQLLSANSPLQSGPISTEVAAWIGGILSIGAIAGSAIFGGISNYFGSRNALLMTGFPIMICWIFVWFGTQPWQLFVARCASGLTGGGVFLCLPIYVAEIADDYIRGQLSSMLQTNFYLGILLGYIAGTWLSYFVVPVVLVLMPLMFFCVFLHFPNTPQYLLKCNRPESAEQALRFYRNCPAGANKEADQILEEEFIKLRTIALQNAAAQPLRISEFFESKARRGLMIGIMLMACAQFSGSYTISTYANTIFKKSGSTLDPNMSSIFMGSVQVLGTICASTLIDRLGRKILLLVSSAGAAMSLLVIGVYSYLSMHGYDVNSMNMLPVVSISSLVFLSLIGMAPVPYVIVAEVLPPRIRLAGASICVCFVSFFAFLMLLFFPVLLQQIDLYGCMFLFGGVSAFCFFFTTFVVRETNGMNLDQVVESGSK